MRPRLGSILANTTTARAGRIASSRNRRPAPIAARAALVVGLASTGSTTLVALAPGCSHSTDSTTQGSAADTSSGTNPARDTGKGSGSTTPTETGSGALVNLRELDDFRETERTVLRAFNRALGRQRANEVDETGLADIIDKDVLPPWREMRTRVSAANVPDVDRDMFATLTRYLAERQTAWEAYSAALRASDDTAAAPHYAKYHEQDQAADADARKLGEAFRQLR